jgi:hypothetical protein
MSSINLNEWESQVKSKLSYTFPLASDKDWKIIARVLEEEMKKLNMIKNTKLEGE